MTSANQQSNRGMALRAALLLGCCGLLLSACSLEPPETGSSGTGPGGTVVTAAGASAGPSRHTVLRGDTIYSLARQYNLPVKALIDSNHLNAPFQLVPGQVLTLPPADNSVLIAKGDTLASVAKKHGVALATLAQLNDIAPPYKVIAGQRIKIPADGAAAGSGAGGTASSAGAGTAAATGKAAVHSSAAPPATITAESLPPPGVPASEPGNAGAPVPASAGGGAGAAAPTAPAPGPSAPADNNPASSVSPAGSAGAPLPAVHPAPPPAAAAAAVEPDPVAGPVQVPPSGKAFVWPLKGDVLAEYGQSSKGQHNDGINIAASRGQAVFAVADGTVAYAGNELRGFGNLLLIKHPDGWVTAYAHNEQLLVRRNDKVRRGQQIARAGDSGGVARPQLHFELRQGAHAVDPMPYLAGRSSRTAVAQQAEASE